MNQNLKWDTSILEKAQIIAEREKMLISTGQRAQSGDNQYTKGNSQTTKSLIKDLGIGRSMYYKIKSVYCL